MRTLHIIVCQPFEAKSYATSFVDRGYVVASMPGGEEGVGSARFWCTIIARCLGAGWVLEDEKKAGVDT